MHTSNDETHENFCSFILVKKAFKIGMYGLFRRLFMFKWGIRFVRNPYCQGGIPQKDYSKRSPKRRYLSSEHNFSRHFGINISKYFTDFVLFLLWFPLRIIFYVWTTDRMNVYVFVLFLYIQKLSNAIGNGWIVKNVFSVYFICHQSLSVA